LDGFRSDTVGFGAAMTLLAIAIGAGYLLYDGRRSVRAFPRRDAERFRAGNASHSLRERWPGAETSRL